MPRHLERYRVRARVQEKRQGIADNRCPLGVEFFDGVAVEHEAEGMETIVKPIGMEHFAQ